MLKSTSQTTDSGKASFFRQSGWMVITAFTGGVCMFAVHIFAPVLGDTEYGLFGTLLALMNVMLIPTLGLQTTFAQQCAAVMTPIDQARLTNTVRGLLGWTLMVWLAAAAVVAGFQDSILAGLTIHNPMALWLVMLMGLASLWQPIAFGVLQGRQDFLWLGWAQIFNGLGRFVSVAVIVMLLGGKATGAMAGALIGVSGAVGIAMVRSRMVWNHRERQPVAWRDWLGRVVPLTLGLGASQYLFSVDMILVRSIYGEHQTGYYSAAGMIGRGLVMFSAPLAVVMFPKIVHNVSLGKKSNLLGLTLLITAILSVLAAAACTGMALVLQHLASGQGTGWVWIPQFVLAKIQKNPHDILLLGRLIPWFVWSMLPLALANVLLQNQLAHKQYRAVPYLLLVGAAYTLAVVTFGASFVRVAQILGLFNLLFLGVLSGFFWANRKQNEDTDIPVVLPG